MDDTGSSELVDRDIAFWKKNGLSVLSVLFWFAAFLSLFISVWIIKSTPGDIPGILVVLLISPFFLFGLLSVLLGAAFIIAKFVDNIARRVGFNSLDLPVSTKSVFTILLTLGLLIFVAPVIVGVFSFFFLRE